MNANMTIADIVAVGAGHNGLVAAAQLASAGKKPEKWLCRTNDSSLTVAPIDHAQLACESRR
jgi:hypothetical protein